ncbi:MAG TPA: nitroreductase family protein [Ruminococcus sp.]|nr:nitroreductase family protein [Ruminococcus sp.]
MKEIFERISVRKFKDTPVEPEKVKQLLRAAMAAPSASNQQPWEFYVVTDKDTIKQLAAISPYAACAENAPLVIVPCYRTKDLRWEETVHIDLACAVENMLLEITSLGLGGVWLCAAPLEDRMSKAAKALELPDSLRPFAVVPVGYPDEHRPQQDRFDEKRIHYIR